MHSWGGCCCCCCCCWCQVDCCWCTVVRQQQLWGAGTGLQGPAAAQMLPAAAGCVAVWPQQQQAAFAGCIWRTGDRQPQHLLVKRLPGLTTAGAAACQVRPLLVCDSLQTEPHKITGRSAFELARPRTQQDWGCDHRLTVARAQF
jgi:hypothetical protein